MIVVAAEMARAQHSLTQNGIESVLVQLPVFGLVYRLFTAQELDGAHNRLLDHTLFGTPLSERLAGAGGGELWVFLVLMAVTVVVAAF